MNRNGGVWGWDNSANYEEDSSRSGERANRHRKCKTHGRHPHMWCNRKIHFTCVATQLVWGLRYAINCTPLKVWGAHDENHCNCSQTHASVVSIASTDTSENSCGSIEPHTHTRTQTDTRSSVSRAHKEVNCLLHFTKLRFAGMFIQMKHNRTPHSWANLSFLFRFFGCWLHRRSHRAASSKSVCSLLIVPIDENGTQANDCSINRRAQSETWKSIPAIGGIQLCWLTREKRKKAIGHAGESV